MLLSLTESTTLASPPQPPQRPDKSGAILAALSAGLALSMPSTTFADVAGRLINDPDYLGLRMESAQPIGDDSPERCVAWLTPSGRAVYPPVIVSSRGVTYAAPGPCRFAATGETVSPADLCGGE